MVELILVFASTQDIDTHTTIFAVWLLMAVGHAIADIVDRLALRTGFRDAQTRVMRYARDRDGED
ncbi:MULTISPECIES: hypothetical protein [Mycobacteroides]|uniref:hypothetical protein n=1 Tax=Mycobacteroides TaxID=670516 RepID=UPI0008A8F886|nr:MULTISPECIES: hypothetical protein [Mycobacteroides]OHU16505.1 hypothetical protein BKG75_16255 [Mycobacteroides chelonae]TDZ97087.1 hypothetical protein CCUG62472_01375 [Mycobacteroides salmoniphilum]